MDFIGCPIRKPAVLQQRLHQLVFGRETALDLFQNDFILVPRPQVWRFWRRFRQTRTAYIDVIGIGVVIVNIDFDVHQWFQRICGVGRFDCVQIDFYRSIRGAIRRWAFGGKCCW